jgi:hypothetical protein
MSHPRRCRRSWETSLLMRVNHSSRREDVLWQTFVTSRGDTETLAKFYAQQVKTQHLRVLRQSVSWRTIRRSRHSLMLANARGHEDALTLLDWTVNSPSDLARDDAPEVTLSEWETEAPPSQPLDGFALTVSGPHGPPSHLGGPFQ